jgi:hypothetical protein
MQKNVDLRLAISKYFLLVTSLLLFCWWPLAHWFFSDWYHTVLGFTPGTYPQPMVEVIGTCGMCIVVFAVLAARNPRKNRDIIIGLIVCAYLLAAMYAYLVFSGAFPIRELFNLCLCVIAGTIILLIYPWKETAVV